MLANANAAERSEVSAGGADTIVVSLQLPVERTVRRWNHQEPSATVEERLVVPSSTSFVMSGAVVALADQA
ncbi:MAG: hypothetical protein E6G38_11110 [Actinobacteria bacterium]|nr:MAG: hypothetical protein E6G38_11110 [Actinomycetota bacterium]